MGRLSCHHDIGTKPRNPTGSHDIGHQSHCNLKLGMLHCVGTGHTDIVGCSRQVSQSGNQLLRELQGLLHTVIIQGRGYIVGSVILHVSACGEEEHGDISCYKRGMIAGAIPVRCTRDVEFRQFCHLFCDSLEFAAGAGTRYTHGMVTHTSHHVQIHHRHNTFHVSRQVDTLIVGMLHPLQEILGTDKSLFLCPEEGKDDASWHAYLFKIPGKL